jgi:hypothetical protein
VVCEVARRGLAKRARTALKKLSSSRHKRTAEANPPGDLLVEVLRPIRRYYTWADLLRRVFRVEIFTCPNCGGARRLLAAIQDPGAIERVLRAMGLPFDAPELGVRALRR